MKIDVHTIGVELVAAAVRGKVLEVVVAGAGADGTPAVRDGEAEAGVAGGVTAQPTPRRPRMLRQGHGVDAHRW
jgi:ABC-type sugar transport system substrate-binding protein